MKTTKKLPVRQRYRLRLSRRRDVTLDTAQYNQLKAIGLIVDKKQETVKEGHFLVSWQLVELNQHLKPICTAGEIVDSFGNSQVLIFVLRECQNYVNPDVAKQLASFLGKLIRSRGKAA